MMKRWNLQLVIEGMLFILLAVVLSIFVIQGTYKMFITPRILPLVCISIIVFLVWGIMTLWRRKEVSYKKSYQACLWIWIPLVLITGPLLLGEEPYTKQIIGTMQDAPQASTHPFGIDFDGQTHITIDNHNRMIIMNTKHFYDADLELTKNLEMYQGYTVYAVGFVSYDDEMLTGNDFTIARYLMFCCINDVTPFGITCHYEGPKHWQEYQWVAIKGTVTKRAWHGLMQPVIHIDEITPAKKVEGFIYP